MGIFKNISSTISNIVETRQENKTARTELRTEKAINRADGKYMAQATAYQNGIDPKQAMWSGISSLGESAGGALSSIYGNGVTTSSFGSGAGSNTMILIVVALGALLLMMFTGKGK